MEPLADVVVETYSAIILVHSIRAGDGGEIKQRGERELAGWESGQERSDAGYGLGARRGIEGALDEGARGSLTQTFVACEEKKLVTDDLAANRSAKLIQTKLVDGLSGKEVTRIEVVVADIFE
jgi:hypothetical protein